MTFNFFDGVASVLPDVINRVSTDTTVTAEDFIRGKYRITADLSAGNVTTTFDVGIPNGSIIYVGVSVESGANQHILFSSDPAAKPFADNKGNAEADGGAHIDIEGFAIFKVTADNIIQIDGQASDMGEDDGADEPDSAWRNPDDSPADSTSEDIEFNSGTLKLGEYADGNNEITNPTGLYSRESDGTMKIITLGDFGNLFGITTRLITIEGYVITGQSLSVVDYGGVSGPSDAHQWYAEGTPIVGATGTTYTVTPVDEGTKITVKVNGEESNILKNFYPAYLNPEMWFDPSQSIAGELVNVGAGDAPTLNSGAEQALSAYNNMPVFHFKGQTYTVPDQFNGAAESLTFVTTWVENQRSSNSVFRLSTATGSNDRAQMHIPWNNGTVYFDVQGADDRFSTGIGELGQALLVSYQNNPTDATATIYRSGDPDPVSPYNNTKAFSSASPTTSGAVFGSDASDHFMLDTVISSAELSFPVKEKLEGYVAWKYNMPEILPPSHPYKSAPA